MSDKSPVNQKLEMHKGSGSKWKFVAAAALFLTILLGIDQYSKMLAFHGDNLTIRPEGRIGLWRHENHIDRPWEYPFFLLVATAVPAVWLIEAKAGRCRLISHLGFLLVWAGIIGNNVIDAFSFGYIRDFIWLEGLGCGNLADQQKYLGSALVVAGFMKNEGYGIKAIASGILITFIIIILFFVLQW